VKIFEEIQKAIFGIRSCLTYLACLGQAVVVCYDFGFVRNRCAYISWWPYTTSGIFALPFDIDTRDWLL